MVRGQPRREFLLQLANGVDRLHAVQPVDRHRPAKLARIAAHGFPMVVGHGRIQRHCVPVGCGRPVPHRLLGTGPHGVQHQQVGRSLHPVPVVPVRSDSTHATGSDTVKNWSAPHTSVPQIHQGIH